MDDGYMGSGKVIRSAITKYGIANFTKVILEQFDDSAAMYAREKEIVTDEFLLREDVYNLRRGGFGGFEYIIRNNLDQPSKGGKLGNLSMKNKSEEWWKIKNDRISVSLRTAYENGQVVRGAFSPDGLKEMRLRASSPEAILKRKQTFKEIGHQQGEKNSNYGTMWITNETENKKIKKTDLVPEGWRTGRKIKK
jgi:hypothetical protein